MKNILLIGVGGTGSNAVDMLYRKIEALGKDSDNRIVALVFDTDQKCVDEIKVATAIPMTDTRRLGPICDAEFSADFLKEWFPYNDTNVRAQELVRGASQWRKKSYFAFCNLMTKPDLRAAFHNAMDKLRDTNTSSSYEIYTIASIAGGTGSGSFIPITLYAKRYIKECLGKDALSTAVVACPDIYADKMTSEDNRVKIYSNAYAILRELNAINLVTHGYNDPKKKTSIHRPPVRLKIGDKNSSVGLLFDSMDKDYWHPAAAPFDRVFLLDKIPGLNTVQAHDIVLANSLYTVLCTEIGASIDSEVSNHAMLNSQSNGFNAIYSGIATSELRYPVESILDYVAHRKALEATSEEWSILHRATEEAIRDEQKRARETRRIYTENEGDYAEKYLISVESQKEIAESNLTDILRRGTEKLAQEEGEESTTYLAEYIEILASELEGKIPEAVERETYKDRTAVKIKKAGLFDNAETKKKPQKDFQKAVKKANEYLVQYYNSCVKTIRNNVNSITDQILTFDMQKDPCANETLSVVTNVLKRNGKNLHPVVAMTQLCMLQKTLLSEYVQADKEEWSDLRRNSDAEELPAIFYSAKAQGTKVGGKNGVANSAYKKLGDKRFTMALKTPDNYLNAKKTDIEADVALLCDDVAAIFDAITNAAKMQLMNKVLKEVGHRLQLLISNYRRFFSHLDEEKAILQDKVEATLRKDSGISGSVVNIVSDQKAKQQFYAKLNDVDAAPSMEDIINTEHVAGKGVFDIVYATAQSESAQNDSSAKKAVFSSLFDGMVEAYRDQIAHSNAYQKLASRNVFEVIADACGIQAEPSTVLKAEEQEMRRLIELARPSLMVDSYSPDDNTPPPSTVTVVLMSSKIALYLKRNAINFGLVIDNDQNEKATCRSCAEQFIVNAGGYGARVAVVDGLPANVVYVTSEIIDVQPTHIGKINEVSANPIYFKSYEKAIHNLEAYDTDMWNPHLGMSWHKRGYLPYINPALETESDKKLMKALLYCIMEGKVTYRQPLRQAKAFRYSVDGVDTQINIDGEIVTDKSMSGLITWLRPRADLIEEWSANFDAEVKRQCNQLPPVTSPEDIRTLESKISQQEYIKRMRDSMFEKVTEKEADKRMNLIEFAYAIKTSEEASSDCDDAEKILQVAYETFCHFCEFRLPREKDPGRFAGVYTQQLDHLYNALMAGVKQGLSSSDSDSVSAKVSASRARDNVMNLVSWANAAGCFRSIAPDNMLDANGNIRFENYKFEEVKTKKADTATAPATPATEAPTEA